MNLKSIITVITLALLFTSCASEEANNDRLSAAPEKKQEEVVKKEVEKTKPADENKIEEVIPDVDPMTQKGIGPIKSITLGELDTEMAAKGKKVYDEMCVVCHKPTEKHIGPAPLGILDRRTPEWVMNMILNPEEMIAKDPTARKLYFEFNSSPMANQNLTKDEARSVLEYFRTLK